MTKGMLITNAFWENASMKNIQARLLQAAEKRHIALEGRNNADFLYCFPGGDFLTQVPENDFVLFWDKDVRLASMLEGAGQKLFNSARAIALCDDKTLTHLFTPDFPTPRTILCPSTFPYNGYPRDEFLQPIEEALGYPMVIKEGKGSFGFQVHLAHNREEALAIIRENAGKSLLFQEFIRESAGHDLRLYMVDGACVAAMRRVNDQDFRANIAHGGNAEQFTPTQDQISLAQSACEKLGLLFAGVDLLESRRGPLLCEVNSNAHFTALENLTGADVAGAILDAVIRKISL